jgi:hypothetical protein
MEFSLMRANRTRFRGDFQLRYAAYARDHGMTSEQMLTHDKTCFPFALLKPYLQWVSSKWLVWYQLNPGRTLHSAREEAEFDSWLKEQAPVLDAFTCECHEKIGYLPRKR